jgi:ribosome-binding protein aMBF1 (putative translation factor)
MDHQDWEPVVFKKNLPRSPQIQRPPDAKKLDNLLSDDTSAPETVGIELGNRIQQARANKRLTRAQFAKSLNLQESVIRDHELGVAVKDKPLLSKILRALNIKV